MGLRVKYSFRIIAIIRVRVLVSVSFKISIMLGLCLGRFKIRGSFEDYKIGYMTG